MQDYNYFETGCMELTIGLSCCKYPKTDRLESYWEENRAPLFEYLRQPRFSSLYTIGPDKLITQYHLVYIGQAECSTIITLRLGV
ncbi:M14 family zinc carboxypeptidase, partial [Salmonella sp. s55004]|uniref:M14 family zinc carboxypeptidase n=1 Tax=Salmonella sp. s55004 TaxID=3159675 RepID=UPI0039806DD9